MYQQLHAQHPESLSKDSALTSSESLLPEVKFPGKRGIAPYVATNKKGVPVTQASIVIFLNDTLPAFALQTTIMGRTPHVVSGIGGLGGARVPIKTRGQRKYVSLPSGGERGNGGVLFLPGQGNNTIHLLSWNVGSLSSGRTACNASHAERQFLNWIKAHIRQNPQFLKRIRAIHLYINNSPCGGCTEDLYEFARRYNLGNKIKVSWQKNYSKGTCSTQNAQRLKQSGITISPPIRSALSAEIKPQLKKLKVAKQQQHSYILDKLIHSMKPQAVNRRAERLMSDSQKADRLKLPATALLTRAASLLSRVFASPHNYDRVKRLAQRAIDNGKYRRPPGGGYEVILTFNIPTGWSYGKPVKRLKVTIDQKGGWHYYPVP